MDPLAMGGARRVLRKLGYNLKSRERDRRSTLDELGRVLTHYQEMQARRPTVINMLKVVGFALFSTSRQDEITRIRWADVDSHGQRVLVCDMKNPRAEDRQRCLVLPPGRGMTDSPDDAKGGRRHIPL